MTTHNEGKVGQWKGHNLEVFDENGKLVASCKTWKQMELIAAAPYLLEACKVMLRFSDSRAKDGSRSQEEASFADTLSDLIANVSR